MKMDVLTDISNVVNVTENILTEVTNRTVAYVADDAVTNVTTGIVADVTDSMGMDAVVSVTNTTFLSSLTLQQLNDEEFHRRLAPVIYLAILMVVGIPGNLLVIVVYFRDFTRSTHRTFILVLAALDLAVCVIALPFEITEMRFEYMFYAVTVCKIFRANNIFLTVGSMLVILAMSIERHRRICHPLRPQMTVRMCRISCLCIMLFSIALSSVNVVISGIRHVQLGHNVTGYDCSLDDSYANTNFPLALDTGLFLIAIWIFTTLVVLYSLIAKQIYKQNKFRRRFAPSLSRMSKLCRSPDVTRTQIQDGEVKLEHVTIDLKILRQDGIFPQIGINADNDGNIVDGSSTLKTVCGDNVLQSVNGNNTLPAEQHSITSVRQGNGPSSITEPPNKGTTKVTKITFTISLVFIMSYLPHLLLSLVTSLKREFVAEPGPIASALLPIVTRTIFINNVANPLIYGFLDPKFRRSCNKRIRRAFGC